MIATRLSPVSHVAGVAVAALCCYLVSQSVAAERAALTKVDREIVAEQDSIAKLGTEIATRSRLTQIENWNRQLALQAPRPGQYVDNGVQLASLFARDGGPQLRFDPALVSPQTGVQQVSLPAVPRTLPAPRIAPAPAAPRAAIASPRLELTALAPARRAEPLLRTAAYVRPRANQLEDGPALTPAALHATIPLLSADVARMAQAEQAHHARGGEPK